LTIGVYNSAGELVKTIANTPANALLSIVNIMTANKPTGPNDTVTSVTNTVVNTQQDLQLYLGGLQTPLTVGSNATTFTWDETTNASQIVSTGEYYIKFEEKDQFGHTNILIKEVQVIKVEQFVQLNIYNSGGEIVRSEKVDLVGVINDTDKVTLGIGGTNPDMVEISQDKLPVTFIYGPNIGQNVSWDGLNSNGMAVSSGTYEVQVIVKTNQGKQVEASKTIIILNNSTKSLSSVLVLPNPLKFGVDKSAKIGWMGTGTSKVRISIYNPSGEAVRFLSGKMSPSGIGNVSTGSINWDMRTSGNVLVAQGYYILIAESDNDQGHIDRKIIKFAIK
jgi:flagellar hook assembly protein FlgD